MNKEFPMTPTNVLITGGAGFIGSNLALQLHALGHRVRVLDNLSPQIHPENCPLVSSLAGKAELIVGDVRQRADWIRALEGQEMVVHLAAETGTGQSMYEIDRYVDVNVRGTGLLLDILANQSHRVKKILVASSRSIYGEGKAHCSRCAEVYPSERADSDMKRGDFQVKCPVCGGDTIPLATDEGSKLHPSSIYGITKLTQEQLVLKGGQALGIHATALRYQNVYGPGQSLSNPYTGILSIFSTRLRNGNGLTIFEDGLESRDFVYIDDVVSATIAALFSDAANFQVFNVGSGVATSVMEVARALHRAYGSSAPIEVSGSYRVGDIRHNYADLRKISDLLGYQPSIDFSEGATRFTEWVLGQAVNRDTFDVSIEEMKKRGLYN